MIQRLTEASDATLIQETTFGIDVQGRYVCNTWDEAVGTIGNGGFAFDAVVIGAGMFGAYCAEKIFRESGKARRVLVLDAGSFLVSEHVQNLSNIGLGVGGAVRAAVNGEEPSPQNQVANGAPTWGLPWHSNEPFPGLAYCVGGRSLYWGGWSPRLTAVDLARWPAELAQYLNGTYNDVEREIGVDPTTDYISGPLFDELLKVFKAAAKQVPSVDRIDEAPLAIQGAPPAPGLFSFDKYSSAPILITGVRSRPRRRHHRVDAAGAGVLLSAGDGPEPDGPPPEQYDRADQALALPEAQGQTGRARGGRTDRPRLHTPGPLSLASHGGGRPELRSREE